MNKTRTWHGTDASNEVSLFEYGLLIRWNAEQQHYDVIHCECCEENNMKFIITYFDADDWRKMLTDGEYDLADVADMCCIDPNEYLDIVNDVQLLYDLLCYYGSLEVLGSYYSHYYTESEIRKKLNRALL